MNAMIQQHEHEKEVRPRQEMTEAARRTHRRRLNEIRQVIRVSTDSPPATSKQDSFVFLPVVRAVTHTDESCGAGPNYCFTFF
jgi:hypothetical protein